MKPSERRKAMKAEMAERAQEAYNNKDDSGRFKSYLKKPLLGKVPLWKCSEDEHFLNIIPFIAGEKNPNVKPGKMAYMLDIFVHRKVGVNEDAYVCLSRSYGKPCPICEHQAEMRKQDEYDEKLVKSMNPTRRALYNIECMDSDKQQFIGIQVWDVSHYLFEKELAELAKKPRGGGFILFSDPDEGKTVFFRKSGSGATNTEYKAFNFVDREDIIPDEVLDSALCLDELIHVPTYDEVYAAFHGTSPEEEEQFACPGSSPEDFGELEACDICPDAEVCEEAFNAASAGGEPEPEQEEPEAKPAQRRRPAADPEPEQEEEPAATTRRRRPAADPEPEQEKAESAGSATRRVRRRPGA